MPSLFIFILLVFYGSVLTRAQWTQVGGITGLSTRAGQVMFAHPTIANQVIVHAGSGRTDVVSSTDLIQWTTIGNIENRRQEHTVLFHLGKYWSIAGFNTTTINQVRVSSDLQTWTIVSPDDTWPHPVRADHCSLVFRQKMWTLGGASSPPATAYNTVFSSTNGSTWLPIVQSGIWSPRYGFACYALNDDSAVFVIGGRDVSVRGFGEVWRTTDMSQWVLWTNSVPWTPRALFASVFTSFGVLIAGGRDVSNVLKNDMFYSHDFLSWTLVPWPSTWTARELVSMVQVNSTTLMLGCGSAGAAQNDIHTFSYQDPCISSPCQSGATCFNRLLKFECVCMAGFVGTRCETDVDECASSPCSGAGTAQCVDRINRYECRCIAGFTGTVCQTETNECASNPCASGATCVDLLNAFTCICAQGWTGATCSVDINECATNNGGCPFGSICTNGLGGYNCTAFIESNTLFPFGSMTSNQPWFTFNVSAPGHFASELDQVSFFIGPISNPSLFPCEINPLSLMNNNNGEIKQLIINCSLKGESNKGYGANHTFWTQSFGSPFPVAFPDASITFPAPLIVGGSLRFSENETWTMNQPKVLSVPTIESVRIWMDVRFISSLGGVTQIRYGYQKEFTCQVEFVSDSLISCWTQAASFGSLLPLTVIVGNQATQSLQQWLTFPERPRISIIQGCFSIVKQNGTGDCPTEGAGLLLTLSGFEFSATSLSVFLQHPTISSQKTTCISAQYLSISKTIECVLPEGTGQDWIPVVFCSGLFSDMAETKLHGVTVNYHVPIIDSMVGCASTGNNIQALVGCSRTTNNMLTLYGSHFGSFGLVVLIGSKLCQPVVQDLLVPHRKATCTLAPATFSLHQPVLLIQSGGGLGFSNATVSFLECQPGTQDQGLSSCIACSAGKFSATSSASECTDCPLGTFSDQKEKATACKICGQGKYSNLIGSSLCIDCQPGSYSLGNQTANKVCLPCPPGSYAATPGTLNCLLCPIGKASLYTDGGAQSCTACVGTQYTQRVGSLVCETCGTGQYFHARSQSCRLCPPGVECSPLGIRNLGDYFLFQNHEEELQSARCLSQYCEPCPYAINLQDETNNNNNNNNNNNTNSTVSIQKEWTCCSVHRIIASQNPYCGMCEPGFYNWNNRCVSCSSKTNAVGFTILFVLIAWLYITVFHRFAQFQTADTRIMTNYAQFVFLYLSSQAGSLSSWMSIFNFNILSIVTQTNDSSSSSSDSDAICIAKWSDLEKLVAGLWMPLITLSLLLLNFVIHVIGWHTCVRRRRRISSLVSTMVCMLGEHCCPGANSQPDDRTRRWTNKWPPTHDPWFYQIWITYQRTLAAFALGIYAVIAQTTLSFFNCIPLQAGRLFLYDYPSVSCNEDNREYQKLYPLFIILLIIVVATPIIVALRLWRLHHTGVLHSNNSATEWDFKEEQKHVPIAMQNPIRYVYGAWAEMYKPNYYAWEACVVTRRLVTAIILLSPSLAQQSVQKFQYLTLCGVLFFMLQVAVAPYRLTVDNRTEWFTQSVLIVLTLFLMTSVTLTEAIGLSIMTFTVLFYLVVRITASRFSNLAQKLGMVIVSRQSTMRSSAPSSSSPSSAPPPTTVPLSNSKVDIREQRDHVELQASSVPALLPPPAPNPSSVPALLPPPAPNPIPPLEVPSPASPIPRENSAPPGSNTALTHALTTEKLSNIL